MELARVTSKGQLTIPVSIRRKLGIDTGDQLLFYEKNGQIIMAKESPSALGDAQIAALENHVYSLDEIRRIASPIAGKYGVESLRILGSYARGEATPRSDLDIVVARGEIRSMFELGGLREDLADAFRKKIDLLTEDSLEPEFRQEILRDGVMIYDNRQA